MSGTELAATIGWAVATALVLIMLVVGTEACSANRIERALERQCEKLGYSNAMINEFGEFCVEYVDGDPYFVNVKEIPQMERGE